MKDFQQFIHDLSADLHAKNLKLMVALPAADWSYDYKYFAAQTDAIILMNYDFHWPTSLPGPIAPQDWFVRNIDNMVKLVPPDKLIMGIAKYGYDWPAKTKKDASQPVAKAISFQQGVVTAVESGSDVLYDPDSFNLHYSYDDENNQAHNVWMLDGVTAYNELRAAERAGRARHGDVAPRARRPVDVGYLGCDACRRSDARQTRAGSSRLRSDPRRRGRHLAHHRDAARAARERSITTRARMTSTTKASRAIRCRGAFSRWAPRRTKWR